MSQHIIACFRMNAKAAGLAAAVSTAPSKKEAPSDKGNFNCNSYESCDIPFPALCYYNNKA